MIVSSDANRVQARPSVATRTRARFARPTHRTLASRVDRAASYSADRLETAPVTVDGVARTKTIDLNPNMERDVAATTDHELTFYFYPAPHGGLNWKSPSSLLRTTITGLVNFRPGSHSIGHVDVGLTGLTEEGERKDIFLTGMRNAEGAGHTEFVFDGYGMGVVYQAIDGRFYQPHEVRDDLPWYLKKPGRLSFVKIRVNPETARRLAKYLSEYDALDYDKIYGGLPHRPLRREGAGCSAFAVSFLEVLDLLHPEIARNWSQQIDIGEDIIYDDTDPHDRKVGLAKVLLRGKWVKPGEESRHLHFWDPDSMHTWTERAYRQTRKKRDVLPGWQVEPAQLGKARGLVIDLRDHAPPEGPFFEDGADDAPVVPSHEPRTGVRGVMSKIARRTGLP